MMIGRVCRIAKKAARTARFVSAWEPYSPSSPLSTSPPFRILHTDAPGVSPVALQMINYALSHARSQKSGESYSQGLLVLEQCLSTQSTEGPGADDSRGLVLLGMATLLSERGSSNDAIDKLQKVEDLSRSSPGIRVAAMEALVGLHLELGQDDTSSVVADKCLNLVKDHELSADGGIYGTVEARANAVKGLVELVSGNTDSGAAVLSYGEFLHAKEEFSSAKEVYQRVIQWGSQHKDFSDPSAVAACNMSAEEVALAATCALGQLEVHLGNFSDAEQILTRALTEAEKRFGSRHAKVGAILTCVALMFRHRAVQERSSSLLIQEGLFRRAIEMLKSSSSEAEVEEDKLDGSDLLALARGGYAEVLCLQQNRKAQGEQMKSWAQHAWRSHRLSLADALDLSPPASRVPIIDTRISRIC